MPPVVSWTSKCTLALRFLMDGIDVVAIVRGHVARAVAVVVLAVGARAAAARAEDAVLEALFRVAEAVGVAVEGGDGGLGRVNTVLSNDGWCEWSHFHFPRASISFPRRVSPWAGAPTCSGFRAGRTACSAW